MQAIADTVLDNIKAAVAPTPADIYRPDGLTLPFVWVRPPSTSIGPLSAQPRYRRGLLTVDVWAWSWAEVDEITGRLAWLNGYVEGLYRYRLESDARTPEPDASHAVLTFGVTYDDVRGAA